jgi:SAM-dependent methyltransferase
MNKLAFTQQYADQYDLLYGDKNYQVECDLLEQTFEKYGTTQVDSILDLGCGTGNHSVELARRGYRVKGVDLSDDMLSHAIKKAAALTNAPSFQKGDVRSVMLDDKFDVVLMMFAVLGYQLSNDDLVAALTTVQKHLKPDGLFIFDVWFGPAVLAIRPSERVKVLPTLDGKVIRAASGSVDSNKQQVEVRYHLWHLSGNILVSETEETHHMRYFFPQELAFFMSQCGLSLLNLNAFPDIEHIADETTWNCLGIGRVKNPVD